MIMEHIALTSETDSRMKFERILAVEVRKHNAFSLI